MFYIPVLDQINDKITQVNHSEAWKKEKVKFRALYKGVYIAF